MRPFLLYRDKSLKNARLYSSFQDLQKDLNLNVVMNVMTGKSPEKIEAIKTVMITPLENADELEYRYAISDDMWANKGLCKELTDLADMAYNETRQYKAELEQNRGKSSERAGVILAVLRYVELALDIFANLKSIINNKDYTISSEGLRAFGQRINKLPIEEMIEFHKQLFFYVTGGEGVFSLRLSGGLKIDESIFLDCNTKKHPKLSNSSKSFKKFYYRVSKKDKVLIEGEELNKDIKVYIEAHIKKIIDEYNDLIDELMTYFFDLYREVNFYNGINNFRERMGQLGFPLCKGNVSEDRHKKYFEDLYEISLGIFSQKYPVPNTFTTDKLMTLITGANQGGKSTFLRSIGIAQVLMQCGMPIPAKKYISPLYSNIHTHFTRKEDAQISLGRLEDELNRMNTIINNLSEDSLVLLNESFASTTEKEGSKIAENILVPLYQNKIQVMMVTHLHEFARKMFESNSQDIKFLIADRRPSGERTYRMIEGEPHYSSYGTDLYKEMIGDI
ncbi:MAG: hypothetical protein K6G63_02245 [Eubacterium sp.]|nr:hypothetical protein [Eubacterium sp.]